MVNYERLFHTAPTPMLLLDRDFYIVDANDAYLLVTMTVLDEIVGRHIFDVFPDNPDLPQATGVTNLHNSLSTVLETGQMDTMALQRYDITRQDGNFEERHWSPRNSPVFDEKGNLTHILHLAEDVTDFVRLQQRGQQLESQVATVEVELFKRGQEIQEKNRRLETTLSELADLTSQLKEESRNKDRFLAMLSHELRNPLAAISAAVTLQRFHQQKADDQPPLIEESTEIIERQLRHLTRLVDDLLDVARVNAGRVELQRDRLNLRTILDQAVEMTSHFLHTRDHDLTVHQPEEPLEVRGDKNRLIQIIANLLHNAAKYTDPGGKIELRTDLAHDDTVRIEVRDNGRGIPPKLLPQIFDLFRQADQTLDRSDGGLGLGLTLVRQLVEAHDGTVSAHSDGPGKGSRFVVCLPLLTASTRPAGTPAAIATPDRQ